MARLAYLLAVAGVLALSGCGSADSGSGAATDVKDAYSNLEQQLTKGDAAACEKMTADYRNKLAASVQLFSAECPEVVQEVGKGLRADRDLRTRSIDGVTVKGKNATLIAHSKYGGKEVRTKVFLARDSDGTWLIDRDHELDDVAPSAPLTAYRAYAAAFSKGDGKKACELSTERGQALIIQTLPKSHGGGTCVGAVPYLSAAARRLPPADVVGGDEQLSESDLYTLQTDGNGTWIFRVVVMKQENGKWLFDHSTDLGVSPTRSVKAGPVA